jgi:hypothetical protein
MSYRIAGIDVHKKAAKTSPLADYGLAEASRFAIGLWNGKFRFTVIEAKQ